MGQNKVGLSGKIEIDVHFFMNCLYVKSFVEIDIVFALCIQNKGSGFS